MLPFVAIALKMLKVPNFVQMKLAACRLRISWGRGEGHFKNLRILVKFRYGHFIQRHLTIEQGPQKKTIFVVPSKQEIISYSRKELQTLIKNGP